MALGYQLGSLLLPMVTPLMVWLAVAEILFTIPENAIATITNADGSFNTTVTIIPATTLSTGQAAGVPSSIVLNRLRRELDTPALLLAQPFVELRHAGLGAILAAEPDRPAPVQGLTAMR